MDKERDCYHGGTRTPGQIHPVICGQATPDPFRISTDEMISSMESYIRAQNSIENTQIRMHPEKYENPAWQICNNNFGTENIIRMNRELLRRK